MGEYTSNYNLYLPSVGETGWGSLINQNFVQIDQNLPITTNDGSKWFVNNASYDKVSGTWSQVNTTKSSGAIHLRNDGYGEALTCAAGNSVITWSAQSLDMKNVYSSTGEVNFGNNLIAASVKLIAIKNETFLRYTTTRNVSIRSEAGQPTKYNSISFIINLPKPISNDSKIWVTLNGHMDYRGGTNISNGANATLNLYSIDSNGNILSTLHSTSRSDSDPYTTSNTKFNSFDNSVSIKNGDGLKVEMSVNATSGQYGSTGYAECTLTIYVCPLFQNLDVYNCYE